MRRRAEPLQEIIKRFVDISVSLAAVVVLSPLLALLATAIRIRLGPPILFRQTRPGLCGKPFVLLKFRTMHEPADPENPAPDAARLDAFGCFLRATSLDELPEMWNVLTGDMSLVGPRPLLLEYLPLYTPTEARRHEVRPGITGWAQVSGRNDTSWEKRFECDLWYVNNRSFWVDMRILLHTIRAVLIRRGISHRNEATMPKFEGSVKSTNNL